MAESPLKISVAMGTYNGERFIREQLESLAAQTLLPFELVITDDGSADRTLDIIADFAATAPFSVRLYRNESRLGFADNFLHATTLCQGDLIAFCDQDDVWLPAKLTQCVKAFSNPDVLLCVHSAKVWDGEHFSANWPNFKSWSCLPRGDADILAVYPGFSMVLRRGLPQMMDYSRRPTNILSLDTKRGPVAHDQWAWIMASVFGSIVQLPEVLAHYRQHGANTQGAIDQSLKRKFQRIAKAVNYTELSEITLEYAQFLADAAPRLPEGQAEQALAAAARMEKKAALLAIRGRIYRQKSHFVARLNAWAKLVFMHGYAEDKTNITLGRNACLKDALFGVSGLYRLAA